MATFSGIGLVIGVCLSLVALIFGVFACIPAGPFEERDLDICVSFLVLSCCQIVWIVPVLIGAAIGYLLTM